MAERKGHTFLSRTKRDGNWSYGGPNGPGNWGGMCKTGKQQSPINIVLNDTREASFTPFSFGDNYNTYLNFKARNNGHTLAASTQNTTFLPTFQGGGLVGKYVFQQLHFHWESEHQIDGERTALEMHLVHYNSKYKDFGTASKKKDGLAVIAVLCEEAENYESELEEFLEKALHNVGEKPENSGIHFNNQRIDKLLQGKRDDENQKLICRLRDLLPKNVDTWFRYEGSLTTPGCDETVMWTVLADRMHVSSTTLRKLKKLEDENGNELTFNFRPVQNLNGRTVFLQVDDSENEVGANEGKHKNKSSQLTIPYPTTLAFVCIFYTAFYCKNLHIY